jgi:nuclear GTP-binding protein
LFSIGKKQVVDASDIIIEVLDARDPLGCRCSQVEEAVLTSGRNKKLILLLNKIGMIHVNSIVESFLIILLDLIPRNNLNQWLKYLRNEFPTIAFRSSTQNQRDRLVKFLFKFFILLIISRVILKHQ